MGGGLVDFRIEPSDRNRTPRPWFRVWSRPMLPRRTTTPRGPAIRWGNRDVDDDNLNAFDPIQFDSAANGRHTVGGDL